jgi:molecular chaperone DnaK (HSP70)
MESAAKEVHLNGPGDRDSHQMRFIGIDLGTTNTTCGVAELSADGRITYSQLPISQPQIDASSGAVSWNHSMILPSAVWLAEGDNVFTGGLCVEYADLISEQVGSRVVHGIKSELANRHWALKHNGQEYRPAEISSILLRTVWAAIRSKSFPDINGIIITIPSSFSSTMRRETLRAAKMAGLPMDKVSLLDEPIAALFSEYGDTNAPFTKIQTEEPILVFDMGGGTVDVTVLKIRPDDRLVEVLSTSRYNQVAGDDLDLEIAAYLWRRLKRVMIGPLPSLTRSSALALLHAGEAVKLKVNNRIQSYRNLNAKELSTECRNKNDTLVASFDRSLNSTELQLSIPIADVLDLVVPFISKDEREPNYGRNIFTPIQQALDSARLTYSAISQVYLVGGGAKFRPVYLELKSHFDTLSQATLDATFAVSAGAARYAAARESDWHVSETTSERLYLRRNGHSFLEVLPDKLRIPSTPKSLSGPLVGNDTIRMEEESRYLRLEFFQGSQASDPQMSSVYTAPLSFPRPLKKETEMSSLVGRIDENKIYRFKIDLTEPGGHTVSKEVEFSAESGAPPATDRRPQPHPNDLDSLDTLFRSEPLQTQLNMRAGASRVAFLPPTTPASVEVTDAPMESLFEERNAILRAMNESWADAYIGDKYLPTRMRATLAELQKFSIIPGEVPDHQPHQDLVELYKLYDVTVIRSLLDHSYLLYGIQNLEGKLSLVVDQLATDLNQHPDRVHILLSDLNEHADSAWEGVRELVEIFLKATVNIPGIYDSILNNAEFGAPFKLTAARLMGDQRDAPERLLKLLKLLLRNKPSQDEFDGKARPIIDALAKTGAHGFYAALCACERNELGRAGPLVLGSFGEEFGKWALEQEMLPARHVPALVQALFRIESRTRVDELVFRLLDKWYRDPEVERRVKEERRRLRSAKIHKSLTRQVTRNLVNDLDRDAPTRDINLIREVEEAATKRDDSQIRSLRPDEQLGNAIADVLVNSVDDSVAAFLIDLSTRGPRRFQRHLLRQLLRRNSFKKLNETRQRLILEWRVTKEMASIQMLQEILSECKPDLHPFVDRMIFEKGQAAR